MVAFEIIMISGRFDIWSNNKTKMKWNNIDALRIEQILAIRPMTTLWGKKRKNPTLPNANKHVDRIFPSLNERVGKQYRLYVNYVIL